MVNKIINRGKKLISAPQSSILSAATIIMIMVMASRILGLVRQRVLAHFFAPAQLSLFFAAFRLPDLIFEVLVFGTFSSAFIPVFTKALKKGDHDAWDTATRTMNIGLLFFGIFALVFGLNSHRIYHLLTPGYASSEIATIAGLAQILFAAQIFFVASYVLTGVLESMRRFLMPALAPLFYNLGIIVGTVVFHNQFGLMAPAIGVFCGAFLHFIIQLPLAYKLGFRFSLKFRPNKDVKQIGKLAAPRMVDLGFLQIQKTVELSLASLISTASYTYFTFANSLQLLPVGLFGVSLSKAALPTLSRFDDDLEKFTNTLLSTLYKIIFLVIPVSAMLIVLRIPAVRLAFGTDIFDWAATVQTSFVLSAFAISIPFQAASALLARGFYALHDTRTPVTVSLVSSLVSVGFGILFILGLHLPAWGLSSAFAISTVIQASCLFVLLSRKVNGNSLFKLAPIVKSTIAGLFSGFVMYFLIKFFDRYAWIKQISFLSKVDSKNLPFEKFVIDTRYTVNLFILTCFVALVGLLVYIVVSFLLGSRELFEIVAFAKRKRLAALPTEEETISPVDTT